MVQNKSISENEQENLLKENSKEKLQYGIISSMNSSLNNLKLQQVAVPTTLSFENLSYIIPGKTNKQLLTSVSGLVKPGSVLAIMGPSGAGKTTLLDILAGRATKGVITEGNIKLNGTVVNSNDTQYLKRISGYGLKNLYYYQLILF